MGGVEGAIMAENDFNNFNEFDYGRPDWLPDIEAYRTPQEDWGAFVSGMRPFWSTRAPMADVGRGLQARYLLGAPYMAQQGVTPSFSQFLSDWPGTQTPSGVAGGVTQWAPPAYAAYQPGVPEAERVAELRRRAQQAATAAITSPGTYLEEVPMGDLGSDERAEWNRRAWLTSQFGSGATAAQANQLAVANLLALQRPTGGAYRGQMADAIRNAMARLQQQRVYGGAPKESFLDWYLRRTGTPATEQPANTTFPSGDAANLGTFT